MIKKVHNCLFTNEDSGNVTFFGGEIDILDVAFYEDDPETVIHVIYINNNAKHPNKSLPKSSCLQHGILKNGGIGAGQKTWKW